MIDARGSRSRGRAVLLLASVGAVLLLGGRTLAIAGIHVYQAAVAPLAASAGFRCRFTPSCSRYAEAVITRDGLPRGGWKTLKRIARCGPWTSPGTIDEP
jgi:putative membrane protein insertion efficiency factor